MTSPVVPHTSRAVRWTILAFVFIMLVINGLLIWQLSETSPAKWCALAKLTSPEGTTACSTMLLKLLDIKDHLVQGLLIIEGILTLSLTAVALGVNIKGTGPGGMSIDVGAEDTKIQSGDSEVSIPTPPSSNQG